MALANDLQRDFWEIYGYPSVLTPRFLPGMQVQCLEGQQLFCKHEGKSHTRRIRGEEDRAWSPENITKPLPQPRTLVVWMPCHMRKGNPIYPGLLHSISTNVRSLRGLC